MHKRNDMNKLDKLITNEQYTNNMAKLAELHDEYQGLCLSKPVKYANCQYIIGNYKIHENIQYREKNNVIWSSFEELISSVIDKNLLSIVQKSYGDYDLFAIKDSHGYFSNSKVFLCFRKNGDPYWIDKNTNRPAIFPLNSNIKSNFTKSIKNLPIKIDSLNQVIQDLVSMYLDFGTADTRFSINSYMLRNVEIYNKNMLTMLISNSNTIYSYNYNVGCDSSYWNINNISQPTFSPLLNMKGNSLYEKLLEERNIKAKKFISLKTKISKMKLANKAFESNKTLQELSLDKKEKDIEKRNLKQNIRANKELKALTMMLLKVNDITTKINELRNIVSDENYIINLQQIGRISTVADELNYAIQKVIDKKND